MKEMMDIKSHARTIDEQNVSKSEVIKARLKQIFCSWMCCPCFLNVQKYLDLFITDAFMEVNVRTCVCIAKSNMGSDCLEENNLNRKKWKNLYRYLLLLQYYLIIVLTHQQISVH